jgi:hypothetical protein
MTREIEEGQFLSVHIQKRIFFYDVSFAARRHDGCRPAGRRGADHHDREAPGALDSAARLQIGIAVDRSAAAAPTTNSSRAAGLLRPYLACMAAGSLKGSAFVSLLGTCPFVADSAGPPVAGGAQTRQGQRRAAAPAGRAVPGAPAGEAGRPLPPRGPPRAVVCRRPPPARLLLRWPAPPSCPPMAGIRASPSTSKPVANHQRAIQWRLTYSAQKPTTQQDRLPLLRRAVNTLPF